MYLGQNRPINCRWERIIMSLFPILDTNLCGKCCCRLQKCPPFWKTCLHFRLVGWFGWFHILSKESRLDQPKFWILWSSANSLCPWCSSWKKADFPTIKKMCIIMFQFYKILFLKGRKYMEIIFSLDRNIFLFMKKVNIIFAVHKNYLIQKFCSLIGK